MICLPVALLALAFAVWTLWRVMNRATDRWCDTCGQRAPRVPWPLRLTRCGYCGGDAWRTRP